MRWPWRRKRDPGSGVRDQLAKLDDRDAEVTELGERLRETQRQNNFSGMVAVAIHRATQAGR